MWSVQDGVRAQPEEGRQHRDHVLDTALPSFPLRSSQQSPRVGSHLHADWQARQGSSHILGKHLHRLLGPRLHGSHPSPTVPRNCVSPPDCQQLAIIQWHRPTNAAWPQSVPLACSLLDLSPCDLQRAQLPRFCLNQAGPELGLNIRPFLAGKA